MKVVVIDDDPIVLEVAKGTLEDMGHEVTTRSSAMGSSAWILKHRPDIVLVDLGMPALPGEEWLQMITNDTLCDGDGYEPAFIVLSGGDAEDLERVVSETCAVGYIQKQEGTGAFEAAFGKIIRDLTS